MQTTTGRKDLAAGCVLIVLGGGVAAEASRYTLGTLGRMGPGYFPTILGCVLALVGALIILNRHAGSDGHEAMPSLDVRGGMCVVGSVLAFALVAEYLGFAPAIFACIFIAAMGDRTASPRTSAILAGAATVLGVLLFVYALNMPLPLWHWGAL